jgi:WD40 repeat protein
MPFPRNSDFVGRSDDLDRLHAVLQARQPVGIRPAGLTGMGGIGKTQLAVEYIYRHKDDYPGGIFWVNAAEPLAQGLAQVGTRLRPETLDLSPDRQLRAAFDELNRRPAALIVFDSLDDPAQLDRPVGFEASPSTIACRLLFTTRRHDLGRFEPVEIPVLPEGPARRLLLRHQSRQAVRDDPDHPERPEAESICRLLGRLPLALELAGAFLAEWPDVSLAAYRERLQKEGCLPTLDDEAAHLAAVDFQPIHAAAVAATLRTQWDALRPGDDASQLLFRVAGQFAESAAIPVAALGLLAGLPAAQKPGHPSPLGRALRRLRDVRLVEELLGHRIRLHPLVREFAAALTPPAETAAFCHACARRVVQAFEDVSAWEDFARSDGIHRLEQCLTAAQAFAAHRDDGVGEAIGSMLRLVRREAHHLRECDVQRQPNAFAQQVLFRAVTFGEESLAGAAERRLGQLARPCLLLRWRTLNESPALVRLLTGHEGVVSSVAVTPDGRLIVSGSYDRTVAVWDLETGARIRQLAGHRDPVSSVAVAPDGRRIASASYDRTVVVWDLESDAHIHRLFGHKDSVSSVAVTPDGHRIVSGSKDETIAVWDLETGACIRQLTGHEKGVISVAVGRDGRRIVSGSDDRTVAVWDLESGTRIHQLHGHQDAVSSVAVVLDGRLIVSGSHDRSAAVWDLETDARIHGLSGHGNAVSSVVVTPDGRRVVSASWDFTVAVWDLETGACIRQFAGHRNPVSSVALSPDGRRIASAAVSPDGRRITSASADTTMAVWDLETGARIRQLAGHRDWVSSVAVTPDSRRIISGSDDRTVAIWDLETGACIRQLAGHQDTVSSVAVTPDGRLIISASADKTIAVWDLETGARIRQLPGHQSPVNSVAVSPDARSIVSGSDDRTMGVWNIGTGALLRRLAGHRDSVNSVAVSPDGRRIASASDDHTVAVWDLESGQRLASLLLDGFVLSVAWHRDGRSILAGDIHGNLYRLEYREP